MSFAQSGGSGSVSGAGASAASGGVATRSLTGGSPGAVTLVARVSLSGVGLKTSNGIDFNVVSGGGAALPYNITATVPNPMYPGATVQTIPVDVQQHERR